MSSFLHDLRFTLRQLRRSPGFTATAILTLGLGIGATTAMYSIVRSTLLAPLPYPPASELVGVAFTRAGEDPNAEQTGQTADFLREHATSFASVGIADDGPLGQNFSINGERGRASSETVRSLRVSSGYLPTLGVPPRLGRMFSAAEDLPGATPTAVLSEGLWRRTLNADPNVLGRVIHLNGDAYTVIGVMPASFTTVDAPDLWQPLHLSAKDPGYVGDNFQLIARLKPGVTSVLAATELTELTRALYRQFPFYKSWAMGHAGTPQERLWPLQQILVSGARTSLLALSAAVLAILLMTCLNLAGLISARAAGRHAEMALRTALGAGRGSMFRLLLTESLVLALAGSILGIVFASVAVPLLLASSPIDLPQLQSSAISVPSVIFAVAAGLGTTLLFGLLPALGVGRKAISPRLQGSRTAGETVPQQRVGRSLLVAQVALATTLLSIGAVLLGTFLHLRSIPSGVRPQHLSALQVNLKGEAYASSLHTQQFVAAVEDRLRQIPGVAEVSAVNGLPLDRGLNNGGYPLGRRELLQTVESRFVTPGYFRTVGTPLLTGTDLSVSDTATSPRVVLINQRMAELWWPGHNPIGEYVVDGGETSRIIGVVANAHDRDLAGAVGATIYHPFSQVPDETMRAINGWFPTTFVLRSVAREGSATSDVPDPNLAASAAAAVTSVDPEIPAGKFAPMQSFIDHTVAAPRFFSWLSGAFAAFALLLTVIGLFGLLSFQVASRTREIGVRMALGARRSQILRLVLGKGLSLTSIGLVLGIVGSLAMHRLLASFIADTARIEPNAVASIYASQSLSLAISAAAMLLAAVAASLLPARRAASIEPTVALRAE